MIQRKNLALILIGASLAALPAFSQEGESTRQEVSVQAFGSFVKTTTHNGVPQSATNSGGVLSSYRFFFTPNHGVEVNYGYSLNTQAYVLGANSLGVKSNQHEVTAAYVYRRPLRRFTPFIEAGVGGLVFDPTDAAGAATQARAAFVYGGGADFSLTHRLFMRAEYRGLVYNSPTYDLPAAIGNDRVTHRAEPSIGFGYRF
ncbi:MAG TPA: outer membrane beta-barrel protein [Bryobacteraceae bacterium]|nr:outer membrane beta-barrel protein [Bryobacteraceae bacterium]